MRKKWVMVVVLLVAAGAAWGLLSRKERPPATVQPLSEKAEKSLAEHGGLFKKGLVQVTDGVHVAIGYGLANSIMIEGSDGHIIVDTMTTLRKAERFWRRFAPSLRNL